MTATTTTGFSNGKGTASLYPTGFCSHRIVQHHYVLVADLSDGVPTILNPGTLTYTLSAPGWDRRHRLVSVLVASATTTAGTISGSPATFVSGGGWNNSAILFQPVTAGTSTLTLTGPQATRPVERDLHCSTDHRHRDGTGMGLSRFRDGGK